MSKQVHAKDKNSDKFLLCMSFAKEVEVKESKLHYDILFMKFE